MKTNRHSSSINSVFLILFCLAVARTVQAQVPGVINYQGRVSNMGANPPGPTVDFKFAIVSPNGGTTHWSHDGSSVNGSEPTGFVTLAVAEGLFSVALGDTSILGMTRTIPVSVFGNNDARLRVWMRDTNTGSALFELLLPDQRFGSVGYAMMSAGVINGAIGTNKLANGAVTEDKLADGSVSDTKLADGAVGTSKMADNAVTAPKIATNAVTTIKINDGAVTTSKIAGNAVTTPKILNGAVTVPKLGADVLALLSSGSVSNIFGTCSNCGLVDILGATNCSPAITLDGCSSQINVWSRAGTGRQMVLLDGQDSLGGGRISVRGSDDSQLQDAVTVSGATSGGGAAVSLRNSTFGVRTVELLSEGPGDTHGGYIAVSDLASRPRVELKSGQAGADLGGWIGLYRPGNTNPVIVLDATESESCARIKTQVLEITGGCDLSENFDIKSGIGNIEPGMIVCIDPDNPGHLIASSKAYDPTVAGIVSGAGGVRPGMLMGQQDSSLNGKHPVALTGRVYCLIDADQGAIQPGDLITSADRPGHGMKASDPSRSHGAILGKAMSRLESGKGLVLVLVSLQ